MKSGSWLALLACLAMVSCSEDPVEPGSPVVATVAISPSGAHTIEVNETLALTASARDAGGQVVAGTTLTWTSSDETVATVEAGIVTGVAAGGPVTITARSGNIRDEVQVTVAGEATSYLRISPQATSLIPGGSQTLTATRFTDGEEFAATDVSWSTSNGGVVQVSASGVVTAEAPGGPVLITAMSGGLSAFAMIHVLDPVANLQIYPRDAVMLPGQSWAFAALYSDEPQPFNRAFTSPATAWSSSNPAVATVDASSGVVTVVGTGEATITATLAGVSASAQVIGSAGIAPKIVSGGDMTCGLTEAGAGYCWGDSTDDTTSTYTTGRALPLPGPFVLVDVAVRSWDGWHNALVVRERICGVVEDGRVYCWGPATDGTNARWGPPSEVMLPAAAAAIVAGAEHFLALTVEGDIYAWGDNRAGQLGTGDYVGSETPVKVESPHQFMAIAAADYRSLALTTAGKAFEWGEAFERPGGISGSYQYGVSVSTPDSVETPLIFEQIAVAGAHSLALTPDGVAYAWGNNTDGQLGLATYESSALPAPVNSGERFAVIAAGGRRLDYYVGGQHSLALTVDGRLFGWGSSRFGQVAPGANAEQIHPQPVRIGTRTFSHIAAGSGFSTALGDGEAYGWGDNGVGQLALDTIGGARSEPTRAAGPGANMWIGFGSMQLSAGAMHPDDPSVEQWTFGSLFIQRHGGFTTTDAGHDEGVRLRMIDAPAGLVLRPEKQVMVGIAGQTNLRIRAASHTASGSYPITFAVEAPGMEPATKQITFTIGGGTSGGSVTPGDMDLVCESVNTQLPAGYHCMENSAGQLVPGMFNHTAMHGTWVDEGAEVCIVWGSDGQATGRYKPAQLGGGSTIVDGPDRWGVIVRRDGTPEGSATTWYVFTAALEAQTQLLTYDSATNTIPGWNFEKKACPW